MLALVLVLSAPTGDAATAESFAASGEAHLLEAVSDGHPLDAFDEAHKNFETAFLLGDDSRYLCRAVETAELALRTATMNKDTRTSWQEIWRDDMKRLRAEATKQGRANCRYHGQGDRLPPRVELLADAGGPPATEPASPAAPPRPVSQDRRPSTAARGLLIGGGLLLAASAALGGVAASGYVQRGRLVDQERALAADAWELGYANGATFAGQASLGEDIRAAHRLMLGSAIASGISGGISIFMLASGARLARAGVAVRPTLGGLVLLGRF